jgi:hypothetical protein
VLFFKWPKLNSGIQTFGGNGPKEGGREHLVCMPTALEQDVLSLSPPAISPLFFGRTVASSLLSLIALG